MMVKWVGTLILLSLLKVGCSAQEDPRKLALEALDVHLQATSGGRLASVDDFYFADDTFAFLRARIVFDGDSGLSDKFAILEDGRWTTWTAARGWFETEHRRRFGAFSASLERWRRNSEPEAQVTLVAWLKTHQMRKSRPLSPV